VPKQLYYKKYERGTRLQAVDTQYSGGMVYTNTPLAEQHSRVLVNYDITTDNTLRSRPGLCKVSALPVDTPFDNKLLVNAQPMTTFDTNTTYQHLVVGNQHKAAVQENTTLGIGELSFFKSDGKVITKAEDNHEAFMRVYPDVEIHDLTLNDALPRYVGCRAFNNDYYWFKPDGTLHHAGYILTAYDQDTNQATYAFASAAIEPKACTVTEAVSDGYNMLLKQPYAFEQKYYEDSKEKPSKSITIQGVQPYTDAECTQLELTPKANQKIYFKIICDELPCHQTGSYEYLPYGCYSITVEHSSNNGNTWHSVYSKKIVSDSDSKEFVKNLAKALTYTVTNIPTQNLLIKATLIISDQDKETNVYYTSTYVTSFNFSEKKDIEAINYDLQNYTLEHAEGMTYWKDRLILWGVPEDKSMLFVSETRNPSYFPYPNNVNLFDEPIVNVVPLLDNLVVFTTSKVYIMTIDSDYIHLTQKCIQNNLRIAPYDVHLMQVVKNMIFFKSGNYYYMIVPKANSLTGELTIAPISKNIEYLLDNFKEELYKILNIVYNYNSKRCADLVFTHYYNYLDYEDVTNVYVFQTPDKRFLNFCLLYNTIQRTWRIYVYETANIMQPITHDATKKSIYGVLNGAMYETYTFNFEQTSDAMGTVFKNYQLYDTGYRDQEYNIKKRYRELQFIIYNRSLKTLKFGTGFFIDGNARNSMYSLEPFIKALSDNTYNTEYTGTQQHVELVVNQTFENCIEIPGATILGSWTLNQSVFPEQTVYKIRFHTSGKGYAPRALLINKDELAHDILNTSYVYRSLYSR
jgi:hypothetical protein